MTDVAERSQSMVAYAQTFGEPDSETTSRLRKNLRKFVAEREATRTRGRHWIQAGVVVGGVALLVGGLLWTRSGTKSNAGVEAHEDAGVVATVEWSQTLELAHGATVELGPRTRVRIVADEPEQTSLELLDGMLTADVPHTLHVRVDGYRIEATAARLELRHTRGVPLIDVRQGFATMYGPDLPEAGVKISGAGE